MREKNFSMNLISFYRRKLKKFIVVFIEKNTNELKQPY